MKSLIWITGMFLLALVGVPSCKKADQPAAKQYDVRGQVVTVDNDRSVVTLDHEDIPGLMQAMQMEFKVDNPKLLEGVAVGDQVHGRLEVRSGDNIITELTKD